MNRTGDPTWEVAFPPQLLTWVESPLLQGTGQHEGLGEAPGVPPALSQPTTTLQGDPRPKQGLSQGPTEGNARRNAEASPAGLRPALQWTLVVTITCDQLHVTLLSPQTQWGALSGADRLWAKDLSGLPPHFLLLIL